MVLTSEERTVLQRRLSDAENAYHAVMTGTQARVFVDQNGERIEYAAANAGRLQVYILALKNQLGIRSGQIAGPMRIWF